MYSETLNYEKLLLLIKRLPKKDIERIVKVLNKEVLSEKKSKKSKLQKLILDAPVWTEKEYQDYLKVREHLSKLRLE